MTIRKLLQAVTLCLLTQLPIDAAAQDYPSRPIKLLVGLGRVAVATTLPAFTQ